MSSWRPASRPTLQHPLRRQGISTPAPVVAELGHAQIWRHGPRTGWRLVREWKTPMTLRAARQLRGPGLLLEWRGLCSIHPVVSAADPALLEAWNRRT